jgi:uncharacterized protein
VFEDIRNKVKELLGNDTSGHSMDHIERVYRLAMQFAEQEHADKDIVALAVLLHEVDDYKLFGEESAKNLTNAHRILGSYEMDEETKSKVIEIIHTMGYNKFLEGVRPNTLEGMIVSDADMCDAIGAIGILRTHSYNASKGNEFFVKTLDPDSAVKSASEYRSAKTSHSVQHFFDKLLKITSMLMTEAGKQEGEKRKKIMNDFLMELFTEEEATIWTDYLKEFNNALL